MNKSTSILHGQPRTYVHDLLAPDELSALLSMTTPSIWNKSPIRTPWRHARMW